MSDAPKPYTYAHMYPDNVMRFTEREVNGMRPLRAVPLYDQAAIDGLLGQLAKCGKENCMGHEIEGHALWVRKERLDDALKQLVSAEQHNADLVKLSHLETSANAAMKGLLAKAKEQINLRLEDLAQANALYGKDPRLDAPAKVDRNNREISWLKDLRSEFCLTDEKV